LNIAISFAGNKWKDTLDQPMIPRINHFDLKNLQFVFTNKMHKSVIHAKS